MSPRSEKTPAMLGRSLPIPTYEEAVGGPSSRSPSEYGGVEGETSESAGLLQQPQQPPSSAASGPSTTRADGYRAPTVESVRSSMESSFLEEFASPRSSAESLAREMIQMEVMDGDGVERGGVRGALRMSFTKRFSSITSKWSVPNPFRGMRCRLPAVPSMPCCARLSIPVLAPMYRLLAVAVSLLVVYVLLATDVFSLRTVGSEYLGPFDPESVRSYAERGIERDRIKHWLEYISSFDHMAGTEGDYVLAKYVQGELSSFGFKAERMQYDVYLNYPKPGGRKVWMDEPKWEAELEEPALKDSPENTPVFHGHSKSGTVKGPVVYANYGSKADFALLQSQGISVKGAVVLLRYGGTQSDTARKILHAERQGAVGALLFTDPKTEGWDWPESAVQRGSVSLKNLVVGDVLTPGWPSLPTTERISKDRSPGLLNIPSLPLSYKDARPLLQAIKGKGHKVQENWVGGIPQVDEYWTGSVDQSPTVHLQNEQVEKDRQPIWNVLGEIKGTDPLEEKVIIGNHRDAWCFGASNPNSGTAIMLEVARVLGKMMEFGWRPLRTIVFANWDASQYNLIGSTEFVEEIGDAIRDNVIAYINLDAAVTGTDFKAAGSPVMHYAVKKVLGRVPDPLSQKLLNTTWDSQKMLGLAAGGDYTAFQHHAGISSLDISFSGGGIPSHSCYDNFSRMKSVVDPSFAFHEALAKILALLALEMADHLIIPFDMMAYSSVLKEQTEKLHDLVQEKLKDAPPGLDFDLQPLVKAVETSQGHIVKFTQMNEGWMAQDLDGMYVQTDEWAVAQRRSRSIRMGNFDKHLLDLHIPGGRTSGREWFRHMVMAPDAENSNEVSYFPSVRDALNAGDWDSARQEVQKVATLISRASRKLLDELSNSPT